MSVQPTVGGTILREVDLGCIRNVAELAKGSIRKQWSLLCFLP